MITNPYTNSNKLHLLLDSPTRATLKCKELFVDQLNEFVLKEKEFCEKNNKEFKILDTDIQQILDLVQQCKDIFELEALSQYIFVDHVIPTYTHVQLKANNIKLGNPDIASFFKIK